MRRIIIILSSLFLTVAAEKADAHWIIIEQQTISNPQPEFVSSIPAANVGLDKPPHSIRVNFSAPVDPTKSSIVVYDPYGHKLTLGPLSADNAGITANMPDLGSTPEGVYHVEWSVVCQCNAPQTLTGNFYFHIQ